MTELLLLRGGSARPERLLRALESELQQLGLAIPGALVARHWYALSLAEPLSARSLEQLKELLELSQTTF